MGARGICALEKRWSGARHENKSGKEGSESSLCNVYHCGLFLYCKMKLLVFCLITGSLPLLYDSSIRIHPNSIFLFSSS